MNRFLAVFALASTTVLVAGCPPRTGVAATSQSDGAAPGKAAAARPAMTLHPRVRLETTLGPIVIELDAERAPISVHNFLRYVVDGYYVGTVFHRVLPDFVVQGGGLLADMSPKPGLRAPIELESANGLSHVVGAVAMARSVRLDSAQSQFFIDVADNSAKLDYPTGGGYAVFGRVVEGMETVDAIEGVHTTAHEKYAMGRRPVVPVVPIVITATTLVDEIELDTFAARAEAARRAMADAEQVQRAQSLIRSVAQATPLIKRTEAETGKRITTAESGLMYADLAVGSGPSPAPTSVVELHYHCTLLDGTVWDSSHNRGKPSLFPLDRVIEGLTEGVSSMNVGGKRRLIIPPYLAYGDQERKGGRADSGEEAVTIPAGSTVVIDVELISIVDDVTSSGVAEHAAGDSRPDRSSNHE